MIEKKGIKRSKNCKIEHVIFPMNEVFAVNRKKSHKKIWLKNMVSLSLYNAQWSKAWPLFQQAVFLLKYRGPNLRVTQSENCSICVKNILIFAWFLKLLSSTEELLRKVKKKLRRYSPSQSAPTILKNRAPCFLKKTECKKPRSL